MTLPDWDSCRFLKVSGKCDCRRRLLSPILGFSLIVFAWLSVAAAAAEPTAPTTIPLGGLVPDSVQQGWGELQTDRSVGGKPLEIGDRKFAHGLGTHANSELVYELERPCERFEAWVGVDAEISYTKAASVVFKVVGDGRELFNSGVMRSDTPAKRVSIGLAGVTELKLIVTDAGDGHNSDHADWADAVLLCKAEPPEASKPVRFTVTSPSLTLGLTEDGEIGSIKAGPFTQPVRGGMHLAGCKAEGKATVEKLDDGGVLVARKLKHAQGHACTMTERFTPTKDGIHWETEIAGDGSPWTHGHHHPIALREAAGTSILDRMVRSPTPRRRLARSAGNDAAGRSQLALRQRRADLAGRGRFHLRPAGNPCFLGRRRGVQPGPLAGRRAVEHDPGRFGGRPGSLLATCATGLAAARPFDSRRT